MNNPPKMPVAMSAGIDHNYPLAGRYEYVLFAADETVVARKSGFRSKLAATKAGRQRADEIVGEARAQ